MLKKNALVVINKNIDFKNGLINGTQALFQYINEAGSAVVSINGKTYNLSKQRWEFSTFYVEQYPICLAWALTIHKSQGMGIQYLSVDIGENIFNEGQAYVALSRAIDPKYLHIKNYNLGSIRCNSRVKIFYKNISEKEKKWLLETTEDKKKKYYVNYSNGSTIYKLPKNNILINKSIDFTPENNANQSVTQPCILCEENDFENNYKIWYGEPICIQCISEDENWKQLSKSELYEVLDISKKKLDDILKKCRSKPEKNACNPRFKRVPLYLLGHVKKHILPNISNFTTKLNTINKFSKKSSHNIIADSTLLQKSKPKTMKDKIDFTYDSFFNKNRSIKEISQELDFSKATIENYLYKAYTLDYNFSKHNLEKLGFNNIIRQEINETINKWKRENPEEKSPKLKWIKTECSQASYLVIKLTLFMDYGIKI